MEVFSVPYCKATFTEFYLKGKKGKLEYDFKIQA